MKCAHLYICTSIWNKTHYNNFLIIWCLTTAWQSPNKSCFWPLCPLFLRRVLFLLERVYSEEKKTMRQGKQWTRTHSKTKFARTQIKYLLSGSWNGLQRERERAEAQSCRRRRKSAVSKHRPLLQKQPLSVPINISSATACSVFNAGFASKLIIKLSDSRFSIWIHVNYESWASIYAEKLIWDWFFYITFSIQSKNIITYLPMDGNENLFFIQEDSK